MLRADRHNSWLTDTWPPRLTVICRQDRVIPHKRWGGAHKGYILGSQTKGQ